MKRFNTQAFTLVEILIVVGILTVLATTAILVVNPVEYLKQSRDAKRIGDIKTIDDAISTAIANSPNLTQGTAQTVYISIPDTATTCPSFTATLPALPTGWSYYCASSANSRKTDGTGWIPINFDALPARSPMTVLPIDPTNDVSKQMYYTYIPGGSYALSAMLESEKYLDQSAGKDDGYDPARFEQGSDLALLATAEGLVGYWPFDEGTGTTASDKSGRENTASFYSGTPTWATGKLDGAINFNGSSMVRALNVGATDFSKGHTMSAWFNPSLLVSGKNIFMSFGLPYLSVHGGTNAIHSNLVNGVQKAIGGSSTLAINNWYFIVGTYDNNTLKVYLNGVLNGSLVAPGVDGVSSTLCIGAHSCVSYLTSGIVDDVRIYNRPLTAIEIKAMYDAQK